MNIKTMVSNTIKETLELFHQKSLRKRNKNSNPTIVCNNCIAGIIYHNLGLKFTSPTINLSINGKDYLEFVKHFKYYSTCDLIEINDNTVNYPIGKLVARDETHQDILIHFHHYSSFDNAKERWIERYSRVNWDNIFYIWEFYDTIYDAKYMYEFDNLNLNNKIILTHRKFNQLRNAFTITCYNNDQPVAKILSYKKLSGKRYLDEFDYVTFLNPVNR